MLWGRYFWSSHILPMNSRIYIYTRVIFFFKAIVSEEKERLEGGIVYLMGQRFFSDCFVREDYQQWKSKHKQYKILNYNWYVASSLVKPIPNGYQTPLIVKSRK